MSTISPISQSRLVTPAAIAGLILSVRKARIVNQRDPKIFLAKVGEGKTISKYQKDQIAFSQGEVADAGFLHPARQDQTHRRFRARQGSSHCNPGTRSFLWRRMSEWP